MVGRALHLSIEGCRVRLRLPGWTSHWNDFSSAKSFMFSRASYAKSYSTLQENCTIIFFILVFINEMIQNPFTRWCSWLRHYATSRKVARSILGGAIGIFHWHNPSGRTLVLGATQLLTEMSTRNISREVKAAGESWQTYHFHVPTVLKSVSLNLLEPSGPVQACNGIALPWQSPLKFLQGPIYISHL